MTNREKVYEVIDSERAYQDERWNVETTSSKGIHTNTEFLVYVQDYVNEALHFASRNSNDVVIEFTQHAFRKIAALAVAAMEQNGVAERSSRT